MTFFEFLESLFGVQHNGDSLNLEIQQLKTQVNGCEKQKDDLFSEKQSILSELEKLKESVDPKLKEWDEKYPEANIEYSGRYLFNSKKRVPIDVRLLITPQDFHVREYLDQWGLIWDGVEPLNSFIVRLYKKIQQTFFLYESDDQRYGVSEYWEFPFEVFNSFDASGRGAFDCDSWAHLQATFYLAAGVPVERVRVVCGMTSQNIGHSTVYVLEDSLTQFRHLNSTSDYTSFKNKSLLTDFPTSGDALTIDKIGIASVWFSFNSKKAWHVFKTDAIEKGFKKKGKKLFNIYPKPGNPGGNSYV